MSTFVLMLMYFRVSPVWMCLGPGVLVFRYLHRHWDVIGFGDRRAGVLDNKRSPAVPVRWLWTTNRTGQLERGGACDGGEACDGVP